MDEGASTLPDSKDGNISTERQSSNSEDGARSTECDEGQPSAAAMNNVTSEHHLIRKMRNRRQARSGLPTSAGESSHTTASPAMHRFKEVHSCARCVRAPLSTMATMASSETPLHLHEETPTDTRQSLWTDWSLYPATFGDGGKRAIAGTNPRPGLSSDAGPWRQSAATLLTDIALSENATEPIYHNNNILAAVGMSWCSCRRAREQSDF